MNNASDQFVAFYNDVPVAFCAVLHLPHGYVKNMKRISRIVTLPDYQGVGIGSALIDCLGEHYTSKNLRFSITTTTPSLINSFNKSKNWGLKRQGRSASASKKSLIEISKRKSGSDSTNRITTSWEYNNMK